MAKKLHRGCLPHEVLIGETLYQIIYCATKDDVHPDGDACGLFLQGKSQIRIYDDGSVSLGYVFNTLLHEILHGVHYHMHMELGDQEEPVVHKFANGMAQVLRQIDIDWEGIRL